jgi:hypothetical protein
MATRIAPLRPGRGGRAREWLARYVPPEVAELLGAVLAASAVQVFGLAALTAYAGSAGETVAFYAVLLVRDLRRRRRLGHGGRSSMRPVRDLLLEFGPAELMDNLAVRPVAMYVGPILIGDLTAGVIAGKIAADVVFYSLAILGYELGKALTSKETAPDDQSARHEPGLARGPARSAVT